MKIDVVPLPENTDLKRWSLTTAEKDTPVLASAFSGQADVIITGDKRHLLKTKSADLPFEILSPAEFIDDYLPQFLKSSSPRS